MTLLNRCKTMVRYVADEALRGNLPFPKCVLSIYVLLRLALFRVLGLQAENFGRRTRSIDK
ncbi:hypothetical protein GYMLUDRAFT_908115 [Collybiopsis luxurians FD-317 M1]|nr:hypothetical protein GYMLUDRAFT_908115 [Collybiopsis luxurians FD-317 M1]